MYTLEFKRNSWHAWLVKHFTPYYLIDANDFCQYVRWFLLAIFVFCFSLAFSTVMLSGLLFDVAWLVGLVHWTTDKDHISVLQLCSVLFDVVGGSIGLAFIIMRIIQYSYDKKNDRVEVIQPGFIKLAYRSLKDKVCFKVKFT